MTHKKPAYHHGNLREHLVETGLRLIAKHGPEALTLREIGARAGVSRTAAYRHFAHKEALLAAICEAGFAVFRAEMAAAQAACGPSFRARLRAAGVAYAGFALRHEAQFRVMFSKLRQASPADTAEGDRAFADLEHLVRSGQQSGDIRPGDVRQLAEMVWSHIHGISSLRLAVKPDGELNVDWLNTMSDLLLSGIGPTAPDPGPRTRRKP